MRGKKRRTKIKTVTPLQIEWSRKRKLQGAGFFTIVRLAVLWDGVKDLSRKKMPKPVKGVRMLFSDGRLEHYESLGCMAESKAHVSKEGISLLPNDFRRRRGDARSKGSTAGLGNWAWKCFREKQVNMRQMAVRFTSQDL